MASQRNRYARW